MNEYPNAADSFAYFGQSSFDLGSAAQLPSASLHDPYHPLGYDFPGTDFGGGGGFGVEHHGGYYADPIADSRLLDVTDNGVVYQEAFRAVAGDSQLSQMDMDCNSSVPMTSADSAIGAAVKVEKPQVTEPQNLSSSTSPTDDKKSCTCKECGKVFNSVWYLKQHAVKHSSERPFKCKFCHKTYRFRSNLYQHKCPLRDQASELASASVGPPNGKASGDDTRRMSTSTMVSSPLPSSESSSSTEVTTAGGQRQRKRRAWPALTSPSSITNGGEKIPKAKVRRRNQNGDIGEAVAAGSAINRRGAISISSSTGSPTSSVSIAHDSTNGGGAAILSEEDVQKFLDRHKDKLHKCPRCKSLWPSREYLTRHMEWHNDDSNRFRCVQCSETFVDEQRYGLHKQNHSPSSLHVCGRCRGKFNTRVALKRHARRCSLVDSKTFAASGQSSNTAINGFRHFLFIDPTPPASPNALANGTAESPEDKSTKDDDGGMKKGEGASGIRLAPAGVASPMEIGSKMRQGNNSMVAPGGGGGMISQDGLTPNAAGMSNTVSANGGHHTLAPGHGEIGHRVPTAVTAVENSNMNGFKFGQLRAVSSMESIPTQIVPVSVPSSHFNILRHSSAESSITSFHHNSLSLRENSFDFHSDGHILDIDECLSEDTSTRNGEWDCAPHPFCQTTYHAPSTTLRQLDRVKMGRADSPPVAFHAVTPSQMVAVCDYSPLRACFDQANQVPVEFDCQLFPEDIEQYGVDKVADPWKVMEPDQEKSGNENAMEWEDRTETTTVEMENVQAASPSHSIIPEWTEAQRYCGTCRCMFIDKDEFRQHWLKKHILCHTRGQKKDNGNVGVVEANDGQQRMSNESNENGEAQDVDETTASPKTSNQDE